MKKLVSISALLLILAIGVSGQNGKKFFRAGEDFVKSLRYEDAIAQFTSAIDIEPSNSDFYAARGLAYEMINKYEEAYADYEKAMVFKPKEVDLIIDLGRASNKLGKYDEALTLLNKASGMAKRNSEIYPEKVKTLIAARFCR